MAKKKSLEEICEYAVKDKWTKTKYNCKLIGYTDYACIKDNPEKCSLYIDEKKKEEEKKRPVYAGGLFVP